MKIPKACCALLVLQTLIFAGCAGYRPQPASDAVSREAGTAPLTPAVMELAEPSPEPTAGRLPEPAPSFSPDPWEGILPTPTPSVTLVPMDPETEPTPDPGGFLPTPTPAWATPYPSPAAFYREDTDTVTLAAVRTAVQGNTRSNGKGREYALQPGEVWPVLEETDGKVRIVRETVKLYVPREAVDIEKRTASGTSPVYLTVASFNMHSQTDEKKCRRIADMLKENGADIVGLQEVRRLKEPGEEKTDSLTCIAKRAGYPYYAFCRTLGNDEYDYGIAVMSRYPIIDSDAVKLDLYGTEEARRLQFVRVWTGEAAVTVFNTHLSQKTMYKKSVNLASFVYETRSFGFRNYIVTGDFNCSPVRIHVYDPGIRYANVTGSTYGNGQQAKMIDNVLYTAGFRCPEVSIVDMPRLSDHKMVVAQLILTPDNG